MKDAVALLWVWLALMYLYRLIDLRPTRHQFVFGLSNVATAASCVWSAFILSSVGWGMLQVLAPIMAGLYLLTSHDAYVIEKTRPAPLDGPIFRLFH